MGLFLQGGPALGHTPHQGPGPPWCTEEVYNSNPFLSLNGPQALNGRLPQGLGKSEGGAGVARLASLLGLRSSSEGASSLGGRVERGPGAQDQGGQSRKTLGCLEGNLGPGTGRVAEVWAVRRGL